MGGEVLLAVLGIIGNLVLSGLVWFRSYTAKMETRAHTDAKAEEARIETDRKVEGVQVDAQRRILEIQEWTQNLLAQTRLEMTQALADNQRLAAQLASAETVAEENRRFSISLEKQLAVTMSEAIEQAKQAAAEKAKREAAEGELKRNAERIAFNHSLLKDVYERIEVLAGRGEKNEQAPRERLSNSRPEDYYNTSRVSSSAGGEAGAHSGVSSGASEDEAGVKASPPPESGVIPTDINQHKGKEGSNE